MWNTRDASELSRQSQQSADFRSESTGGTVPDVAKLDPDDRRPPYRQVADHIRAAVDSGDYAAGEKLPSYDALAEEFGVSLGVVKRAMMQLRDERVVVIRHGQGSYARVDREPDTVESSDLDELRAEMANMGERLQAVERRLSEL